MDDIIRVVGSGILVEVIRPGAPTARGKYFTQDFMQSRLTSESFEPLIGFLVFLVQKLWPKNIKIGNFTLTFEPETLESQAKTQKTQILAYFPLKTEAKYFPLAVGNQGPKT